MTFSTFQHLSVKSVCARVCARWAGVGDSRSDTRVACGLGFGSDKVYKRGKDAPLFLPYTHHIR